MRRLAFIEAEGGPASRLKGALVVDGAVSARGERVAPSNAIGNEGPTLMRDLLVRGNVLEPAPSILASPIFWLSVGVVAAGAATGSYFLLREPDRRTQVVFW